MFELQLAFKVCYNVKCKEYIQTAADGCQSLLCFKDRFMPVFFYALNQEKYLWMSYYVGRFFEEFFKKGLKNGCFLSLLMRGIFYKRIFRRWRFRSPLVDIITLKLKNMSKTFLKIFSKVSLFDTFDCYDSSRKEKMFKT